MSPLILGWKLLAFVEREFQRRVVRLQQHIRNDHFIFQLRMLALMPRILMPAHVPPRPAVESAFLTCVM